MRTLSVFDFAILLLLLSGFDFYQMMDANRFRDRKRFWICFGTIFPLIAATCFVFWIGIRYPIINFWGNAGFESGWECLNLGVTGAQVCARDLPANFQNKSTKVQSAKPN